MPKQALTPRHEQFCAYVAEGLSSTAAYMRAYASTNEVACYSAACRLLRDERITARIGQLQAEQRAREFSQVAKSAQRHRVTKEYILTTLREVAERCMTATPVLDHDGEPTGEYRFDASGANRALELMGKEIGMFVTKVELGRAGEFARLSKLTDYELAEEMLAEMANAQQLIEQLKRTPGNDAAPS